MHMKKLTLTLSSLALSTVLFAQSYQQIAENNLHHNEAYSAGSTNAVQQQWENSCSDSQTVYASSATVNKGYSEDCSTSSAPDRNPPKRHSVPNKAYSVKGGVSYITSLGLRLGTDESGLTVKHFINSNSAFEGILSTGWRYRGARVTGLYEVQRPIGTDGLYWMWGVGAHAGLYTKRPWNSKDCNDDRYELNGELYNCDGSKVTAGVDALLGLEYHFSDAPFTVGVDLKPSVDLLGWGNRQWGDAAFTIRYVF
ncbi:hypothetical protein D770_10635 [Flammeovirgaceae bacterium 311]|nr:hypothetical protein D770_10635 [Flammeovirgaceae bacterium 311]